MADLTAHLTDAVNRLRMQMVKMGQRVCRAEALQALEDAGRTPRLPFAFRSQYGEDLLIWDAFGGVLDGFYIEAGAFDGRSLSVTYALEALGWNGLLVEAIPERYEQARANRPGSRVVHGALGNKDAAGTLEFTVVDDSYGGMYSYGRATPQHIGLIDSLKLPKRRVAVPYIPLDALLKGHTGPIDVAMIDVEGAELDVLRGFDLDRFKPRMLLLEDMSGGTDAALTAHMQRFPYSLVGWVGPNRVYVRTDETEVMARAKEFL